MMAIRIIDLAAPDSEAYCPCCGRCKPLDAFGPDARKLNGRQTYCRACDAARKRRIRMVTALRVTFERRW